jgi:hypothetical protein
VTTPSSLYVMLAAFAVNERVRPTRARACFNMREYS